MYINKSGTLNINISDHYPVFAIRKKQRHHIPKKIITCRIYRNYHKDLFVDNLINQDWSILTEQMHQTYFGRLQSVIYTGH